MKKRFLSFLAFTLMTATAVFVSCTDHVEPIPDPTQFAISDFASGLRFPIGMAVDEKGQIWVSEAGTGKNDGALVLIGPGGTKTVVLDQFASAPSPEGTPEGLTHMYYENGKLYLLHGLSGFLYTVDVSNFKPGDPKMALNLVPKGDVGTFIRDQKLVDPINSNAYTLTKGPGGHLYIVDAGSNAIFKRDMNTHALSLFAEIPGPNDTTDAVPTGIVFDGSRFLVSNLTGFPFVAKAANIFQVTPDGQVSVYKSGFTTLTHLELTVNNKPLALHFSDFSFAAGGFVPMSGSVQDENGNVLAGGLMMPTDIKRSGDKTYYVLSYALGTIQKLTY